MTTTQKHWWTTADALTAGTRLGDFVDGVFQPATVVLHTTLVEGTTMCRIATAAGTFVVQRDATFYAYPPVVRPMILTRNVTADDLAIDSLDDDGYAADDVIGTAGSVVQATGEAEYNLIEVTGFINDPLAVGFIPASWAVAVPDIAPVARD